MRLPGAIAIATLSVLILSAAANAQRRPVKKPATKKPAKPAVVVPPLDVRVEREKIDDQLALLNDFINKYGPIAVALEESDREVAAGRTSAVTARMISENKQKIVGAIGNIGTSLTAIESDFRTKAALKTYLPSVQGVAALGAEAEDLALASKFVDAKEPLRLASQKLMDALAVLPK